jgi:catechol 2,3-dioxygenase-like lactoylglutathione lyase family enzyme
MITPPFYKRVTLVVADIERSLTIYRDILGFTVNSIQPSDDDSYSYPVFRIPKEAKITFATLDSPDQERTIGLTEVRGVSLPKQDGIAMAASVINVSDLQQIISKIEALGLETTHPEMDSNDHFSFLEQAFFDFDGHLIVLYEILPN